MSDELDKAEEVLKIKTWIIRIKMQLTGALVLYYQTPVHMM